MNNIPDQNEMPPENSTPAGLGRKAFLGKAAIAGAAIASATVLLPRRARAAASVTAPNAGDIAILQFLAAAELIEADLWQQYSELAVGNQQFRLALQRIDPALPDYVDGDYYDELSHAEFINAYLESIGQEPVNLDAFRTLPSAQVQGALDIGRLTNLTALKVDTSYYNRYRMPLNPDFGDQPTQIVDLMSKAYPAIPTSSSVVGLEMEGVAQTAAFHFAAIEQGGSSLYNALLGQVTSTDAVSILASIGSTEVYHFAAFMTSLEGIRALKTRSGITFPAIDEDPTRGIVTPQPCKFLDASYPVCSVIRPRSIANAGPIAAATSLVNSQLFQGQPDSFFSAVVSLAQAAEAAVRNPA
jgi:hypothetical protein